MNNDLKDKEAKLKENIQAKSDFGYFYNKLNPRFFKC